MPRKAAFTRLLREGVEANPGMVLEDDTREHSPRALEYEPHVGARDVRGDAVPPNKRFERHTTVWHS